MTNVHPNSSARFLDFIIKLGGPDAVEFILKKTEEFLKASKDQRVVLRKYVDTYSLNDFAKQYLLDRFLDLDPIVNE